MSIATLASGTRSSGISIRRLSWSQAVRSLSTESKTMALSVSTTSHIDSSKDGVAQEPPLSWLTLAMLLSSLTSAVPLLILHLSPTTLSWIPTTKPTVSSTPVAATLVLLHGTSSGFCPEHHRWTMPPSSASSTRSRRKFLTTASLKTIT